MNQDIQDLAASAMANLPPVAPPLPYAYTPEGQRLAKFMDACPEEFRQRIDRAKLASPTAFDRVALWPGAFPGPTASGPSSSAKTRAAWSALGRLWVNHNLGFSWWPVRRLIKQIETHHGELDGLLWTNQASRIFFVDDADKINWSFDSSKEALFAFYDHIYRIKMPCITTTNQPRSWWSDKMGEAFARRLFDDAGFSVEF